MALAEEIGILTRHCGPYRGVFTFNLRRMGAVGGLRHHSGNKGLHFRKISVTSARERHKNGWFWRVMKSEVSGITPGLGLWASWWRWHRPQEGWKAAMLRAVCEDSCHRGTGMLDETRVGRNDFWLVASGKIFWKRQDLCRVLQCGLSMGLEHTKT